MFAYLCPFMCECVRVCVRLHAATVPPSAVQKDSPTAASAERQVEKR